MGLLSLRILITQEKLTEIVDSVDANQDGLISFDQFSSMITQIQDDTLEQREQLREEFKEADQSDSSGGGDWGDGGDGGDGGGDGGGY